MLEKVIVKQIMDYLKSLDGFVWKNHGSQYMMPGISDIIGVLDGRFIAIEVKAKSPAIKYASEAQINFCQKVIQHGGIGMIVSSLEEAKCKLRS